MWKPSHEAPDKKIVMTKIDDKNGVRNEGALYKNKNLWYIPDGSLYVYYTPTHYRELTEQEKISERNKLEKQKGMAVENFDRAMKKLGA